jgi:subtilisin family serine protease
MYRKFVKMVSVWLAFFVLLSTIAPGYVLAAYEGSNNDSFATVSNSVYGGTVNVLEAVYEKKQTILSDVPQEKEENSYIVKLKENTNEEQFLLKNKSKIKKPKKIKNLKFLEVVMEPSDAQNILRDPDVLYIEPNATVSLVKDPKDPKDPKEKPVKKGKDNKPVSRSETIPWGLYAIGADQVIENNIHANNIKIAVLDTGISKHPDLKLKDGVSFVEGNSSYFDDNGHGTHVAGIIAALENKQGILGIASKSEIYSVKVLDDKGSGTYSNVIQGIEWAIENKMDIISLSLGGTKESRALQEAIRKASSQGIIIVAAAGNLGNGDNTLTYPALYPEVVSVGAVSRSFQRAGFSSTGDELDLVAPGVDILSTTMNGAEGVMSGTSMAAPHVTGSIALILAKNKKMTADQVKGLLYETATPLGDNREYGHGLINIAKALGLTTEAIEPLEPPTSIDKPIVPVNDTFDVLEFDQRILRLNNRLLSLREIALDQANKELVNQIDTTYNELLLSNAFLHELPDEIKEISKEDFQLSASSSEAYFREKAGEFGKLEKTYGEMIGKYSTELGISKSQMQEDVNAAKDYYYEISPGQSVRQILGPGDSDYYSFYASTSGSITAWLTVPYNADHELHTPGGSSTNPTGYSENVTFNVSAGNRYTVKVQYYSGELGYYTLELSNISGGSSGGGTDNYEPNDSTSSAVNSNTGSSYTSYISSASDVDYFRFYANNSGSITVTVSVPSGKDYDVDIMDNYGSTITNGRLGAGITESMNFNVTAGNYYYIKVFGYGGACCSSPYTLNIGNILSAPASPAGLTTSASSNSITLSWYSVSGASSYKVRLNGTDITSTSSTSYTFTGLQSGTTYTLGVSAANSYGNSTYSNTTATTTPTDTYEPNDSSSNAYSVAQGSSYVSYISNSTDVDYYRFVPNKSGNINIQVTVPNAKDYDVTVYDSNLTSITGGYRGAGTTEYFGFSVTANSTYYIKVYGYNGAYSPSSYTLTLEHIVSLPAAPTGLSIESAESSITLDWNAVSGASSYSLTKNGVYVANISGTSYTFGGLAQGTWYTLGVAAVNSAGTGSYSTITATTRMDTFEPNNTMGQATRVYTGNEYTSYISSASDFDYYSFIPNSSGIMNIKMYVPYDKDYDFAITDSNGTTLALGLNGTGGTEDKDLWVTAYNIYYVKVYGYAGANSPNPYRLLIGSVVSDYYEPNNSLSQATQVSHGNTYSSYIYSSTDIDYYKFTAAQSGTITIRLVVPSNKDYELVILDQNGSVIRTSALGTGMQEVATISVTANSTYYVKVLGYNGAHGPSAYSLNLGSIIPPIPTQPVGLSTTKTDTTMTLSWNMVTNATSYYLYLNNSYVGSTTSTSYTFTGLQPNTIYTLGVVATNISGSSATSTRTDTTLPPPLPVLGLNAPVDVILPGGSYQVYQFTPASSGDYRFFTGPYGGYGTSNDTYLELYRDANLTSLITQNDDWNGTRFSEVRSNLVGGVTYYLKLRHYSTGEVQARLAAAVYVPPTVISTNAPFDVIIGQNESRIFKFTPSVSGQYKIYTTYYAGNSANGVYDTLLYAYQNENLTTQIGYNDDANGMLFSELKLSLSAGVSYYFKLQGWSGKNIRARLAIEKQEVVFNPIAGNSYVDVSKPAGTEEYYSFTPTQSGLYRIFSSPYQGTGGNNDTVLELYSDASLTSRIGYSDDVFDSPYPGSFSKIEYNLTAGRTYYIKFRNYFSTSSLYARLNLEEDFDGTRSGARPASWEEILSNNLSSRYDVDYYRIEVTSPTQVHLEITANTVTLEDSAGNKHGIFTPNNREVFNLTTTGTYYARVEYLPGAQGLSAQGEVGAFAAEYQVAHKQSKVSYGLSGQALSASSDVSQFGVLDDSIGSYATISFFYWDYHNTTRIEVFNSDGVLVHEDYLYGLAGSSGSSPREHTYTWYGTLNRNTHLGRVYDGNFDGIGDKVLAKNGMYTIRIAPTDWPGINFPTYNGLTVTNDSSALSRLVGAPPAKNYDGTTITSSNKNKSVAARNYFIRYVWEKYSYTPQEAQYISWSQKIYGLYGLERFWHTADTFMYDPSQSPYENLQTLLGYGGMIPVIGELADGTSAVLYLINGDEVNAAIAAASMIPIYGTITGGVKVLGTRAFKTIYKFNPCANCFTAGTQVLTEDGEKPIEEVQIGDKVLAKNSETGELGYKLVDATFRKEATFTYRIHIGSEVITTTAEHPFWVVGKGWISAKEIAKADLLETYNGTHLEVDRIEVKHEKVSLFNLSVQDFHTYFVTRLNIFTHNATCIPTFVYEQQVLSRTSSTLSGSGPSDILGKELNKAGLYPDITDGTKWEAHHIVPTGAGYPAADAARTLLKDKFKIDINSAANGIWAPKIKGETFYNTQDWDNVTVSVRTHNRIHTHKYYDYVNDQLRAVYDTFGPSGLNRSQEELTLEASRALHEIRKGLIEGTIAIGKAE